MYLIRFNTPSSSFLLPLSIVKAPLVRNDSLTANIGNILVFISPPRDVFCLWRLLPMAPPPPCRDALSHRSPVAWLLPKRPRQQCSDSDRGVVGLVLHACAQAVSRHKQMPRFAQSVSNGQNSICFV